jgi:light-regulated signal transduction histidine kinase (bacteriophytochrome)
MEYAQRVFEIFQTLKLRDRVEGSGMGLAVVSRIIEWQGGRVWFEPAATCRV